MSVTPVAIDDVMQAIALQISDALVPTLAADDVDLQVEPRLLFNPTPPAIDIYPADPFITDMSFGGSSYEALFTIRARVSTADNDGGQDLLLAFLDPRTELSVVQTLIADRSLGGTVDDSTVEAPPSGYIVYEAVGGGGALLGCEWRLRTFLL